VTPWTSVERVRRAGASPECGGHQDLQTGPAIHDPRGGLTALRRLTRSGAKPCRQTESNREHAVAPTPQVHRVAGLGDRPLDGVPEWVDLLAVGVQPSFDAPE
jgi:hypothetical protein